MRYYKGDTLMTVTILPTAMSNIIINGEGVPGITTECVSVAARKGGSTITTHVRQSTYVMAGPIGPDHIPLGMIERTEIVMVWGRPWYNHLRAFWDSIFRP